MLTHSQLFDAAIPAIGALALAGAALACSAQTTDVLECTETAQCRDAFGVGSVCATDGFCDDAAIHPRCTQTYPEDLLSNSDVARAHIIIGSLEERSEGIFRSFENAARLAFIQANGRGTIDDRALGLVFCNVESGGEDGLSVTEALTETGRYLVETVGVPAIIGPAKSGDVEDLFQILNTGDDGAGVLFISPSATSDQLGALDPIAPSDADPGLFWRTAPPDSLQGNAIALDMITVDATVGRDIAITKPVAIFQAGAYGDNLASVFARAFTQAGGALPQTLPFNNDSERDAQIAAVGGDATIEEVLFISSDISDTVAFFAQTAANTGYDTKTLFVPDAAATPDVLEVADPARFPQTRGSRPAPLNKLTDLVYAAFLAAYETEYGENAESIAFTANAYDATWLAAYAAKWAVANEEELSGKTMARGLRKISDGEVLQVGPGDWTRTLQSFDAAASFDIRGSSGDLDYDPVSEETSAPTQIWSLTGRDIVGIYEVPAP